MFTQTSYPVIFAHRGASAYAPENTMAAFRLAIEQKADAIELDLKLSSDGHVVVIHDSTVDRTTTSKGFVSEKTAYELSRLDAGSHFDFAFRGEPVPLLEDVFSEIGTEILFNLELTNYNSPLDNLPEKTASLVQFYHLEERVLISSFNPIALLKFRRELPGIPVGLLAHRGWRGAAPRSWPGRLLRYNSLHPDFRDVKPDLVKKTQAHSTKLFTYTVNEEASFRYLFDIGVDGVFTDDPILARKFLQTEEL